LDRKIKKMMVYSHDTFGLGNIRRMLSICQYLVAEIKDLNILVVSGSPMIHSFQIPDRIDYVKLPCLNRTEQEGYSVKFLGTQIEETIRLRSDLIRATASNFKPDFFLVDKKPFGVKNELKAVLHYLKHFLPATKNVLLLRDILDTPESTIQIWEKNGYHQAIEAYYDLIQVVGLPEVFDLRKEYRFPPAVSAKVIYCGYIKRGSGRKDRETVRKELEIKNEKLVLVTPGGGQDGYHLLTTYIASLKTMPENVKSLIICGPEMPDHQREEIYKAMIDNPRLIISEFTNDMMSYMNASDIIISMGGYNTICEILSLNKPAIVVPRVKPVLEQQIRSERMSRLGLFRTIHPDDLTPQSLLNALEKELKGQNREDDSSHQLDLDGLPKIAESVSQLLFENQPISSAVNG